MAKKRIGELPSGSIRKKVYSHSEPCFDEHGNPIIDEKTGKPKMKKVYISITGSSAAEVNRQISEYKLNKNTQKKPDDFGHQNSNSSIPISSGGVCFPKLETASFTVLNTDKIPVILS